MQITPALACLLGYDEVRGGDLGPHDRSPVRKTASIGQKQVFTCDIDLFDVEKEAFPYPDSYFEVVLGGECWPEWRVGPDNAERRQFHLAGESDERRQPTDLVSLPDHGPHVREYTPAEVHDLLVAAGFAIDWLFTEPIDSSSAEIWMGPLLDYLGFPKNLRGEQIYVMARKRLGAAVIRRPEFLYEQP